MATPLRSLEEMPVGVNPIGWSNDDFRELGGDVPLERCLSEMHAAGFEGTELGHKYPHEAGALSALLARHELRLVSGWHSLHVLERPLEDEWRALAAHLDLLGALGCQVAVVAECSRRTYTDPTAPLHFERNGDGLSPEEWSRLASGLENLSARAAQRGLRLAYHPHMGTVVQTEPEIGALMARTQALGLLLDTGHLAFAGADPLRVLHGHRDRIVHVHLKSVRPAIVRRVRAEERSFAWAVAAGVFTVPGDGGIDFEPLVAGLREAGYRGWLVVEAEQDPAQAPPLEYALRARAHLRRIAGV
jgi:myo-inosose-2 dehydratase